MPLTAEEDEHARHIDFGAKAAAYVDQVMLNLNWPRIGARYRKAIGASGGDDALFRPFGSPEREEELISVEKLLGKLSGDPNRRPVLLDVCLPRDLARRSDMLEGATIHAPASLSEWEEDLPRDRPITVYCIAGLQISGNAVKELRRLGYDARALTGGITACRPSVAPRFRSIPAPMSGRLREDATIPRRFREKYGTVTRYLVTREEHMIHFVLLSISMIVLLASGASAQTSWDKVAAAIGKPGLDMPGGVYRVPLPRTDLKVTVDGVDIKPGFALGGWIAFHAMGSGAMVMGDLVLTATEINPVMSKLFAGGISVTALRNHLLRAQPATFYMHIAGQGDPEKLATAIHTALAESKTPLTAATAAAQPAIDVDVNKLNDILQARGNANGEVIGYGIPRADPVTDESMTVPPAMGTGIAINFQPVGGGKAAITGDFVLLSDEVNPVLAAMRQNGIEVTAVHSHMLDDQPRTFYVHFWAVDDAEKLAGGLRAALDKVKRAKS